MKGYDDNRTLRSISKSTGSNTGHSMRAIVSRSMQDSSASSSSSSYQSGSNVFENSSFSMMPDESDFSIDCTVNEASTGLRDTSRGHKPGAALSGCAAATLDDGSQALEKSWGRQTEASSEFCSENDDVAATTNDTNDSDAMDNDDSSHLHGQRNSYLDRLAPSKGVAVVLAMSFALILVLPIIFSAQARNSERATVVDSP